MIGKRALFLLLVLLIGLVPAMSVSAQDSLIESVCLVTDVGKVNDGTFNQFAYEGMTQAADDFDLETTYIETQAQTDYEANIQTCLDSQYDAVITVGFLITDATLAAANANPNVYFIGVDQFYQDAPPNIVGIQFREDQAGYLAGVMAALMTKSNTIGGVYGIAIPPVIKYRNGYEQGAKYINPDIQALGVYIDDFYDPARGAETARQMVSEGADVIFGAGGPTGSGGIKEAASEGVYVIGVDQDEYYTTFGNGETPGAEYLITSAMKRVDVAVYASIEALVNGDLATFQGDAGNRVFSAANDGVGFAPPHDAEVPEAVTAQMDQILAGLADGSIETGVDPLSGELLANMEATPEATAEASS